jgi:hypothetical protein
LECVKLVMRLNCKGRPPGKRQLPTTTCATYYPTGKLQPNNAASK